jgi:hypothetical protein
MAIDFFYIDVYNLQPLAIERSGGREREKEKERERERERESTQQFLCQQFSQSCNNTGT